MTSTAEFPGGYPPTPQQEKDEKLGDESQKEKSEGSFLQSSKDFISSVMPGKEKNEENKETAASPREKGEENKETVTSSQENGKENKEPVTQPQEKNEGSFLQYTKGLVSSVMPGKENNEGNKETTSPPQGRDEGDKKLEFQPDPSKKPADDNNIAKVSTHGSSALGGITNPINLLIGDTSSPEREDADSPVHPAFKGEVDTSHTIKPHNIAGSDQKGQKSSDVVLPNAVLPESRLLPKGDQHQKSDSQPTFDLTGDYNKQKEREQEQEKRDHKSSGKQKQEEVSPKDKYISPHSPPVPVGSNDRSGKGEVTTPTKPSSAVYPDDQDVIPKVTKKDKVNATVGKAVGILKERIGKLVKNDNMAAKGAEKKAEAKKTKELAEVQKRVDSI